MLTFSCSSCGSTLQIDSQYAGRKVTCPGCSQVVSAPAAPTEPAAPTGGEFKTPSSKITPAKTEESPPRRRRMDRDEDRLTKKPSGTGWMIGVGLALLLSIPCCGLIGFALMIPALNRVRGTAANMQEQNNFKQIVLAAHNHHDTYMHFPSPKVFSLQKNKSVDLSWRVSVLPFIEQAAMFNALDKDNDYNSPRNLAMGNASIAVYMSVTRGAGVAPNMTFNQTFTGPNTIFPKEDSKTRMAEVTDGTSNTFLYAEALAPVPWMKGQDMNLAVGIVPVNQPGFTAVMADGSVRRLDRNRVTDEILRKVIDPRDGIVLPVDWENGGR